MLTTQRSHRTIVAIALAGALVAPAASVADDHWAYSRPRPEARQDLRTRTRGTPRWAGAPGASRT